MDEGEPPSSLCHPPFCHPPFCHPPSAIVMSFARPEALWLLLLVPAAAGLYAYAARRRREALALFFGGRAASEAARAERVARVRRWRAALVTAALAALVVALDVSASMLTEDVAPNRLARARLALARLAEARRGDRLGLVVFAGDAFLQCPLTSDRSAFRLFLDAADPSLLATPGSDFARALFVARQAFTDEGDRAPRPRAVLVVSDGENHEAGLDDAVDALRDDGVALLAAGVGTEAGGPVPIYRDGRRVGVKREGGEAVISTLQEGVLRQIAGDAGLVFLGGASDDVAALSAQLDRLDRTVVGTERFEASAERYQWPLGLALLLLLAERVLALRAPGVYDRTHAGT